MNRGSTLFQQPGVFPTSEQSLVLTAALSDGEKAVRAYQEWRTSLDISQEFDRSVFRLLPLLYANLHRLGIEDELTGRLKGTYRLAWAMNHRVLERTRPVLDELLAAGMRVMALKGAPLAFCYYGNVAVRPMADVDLLVDSGNARRAIELMLRRGFVPTYPPNEDTITYRHALQFTGPDQFEFDLHWHVVIDCCDPDVDEQFWSTARRFELSGRSILMPDPTRMLLHTLVHGLRWNAETPIRWVADAVQVLRCAEDELDWESIEGFATRYQLTHRLWLGLKYLRERFEAPVPASLVDKLAAMPLTLLQRLEQRTILEDGDAVYDGRFGPLLDVVAPFSRYALGRNPAAVIPEFMHYLRYRWDLEGRHQIPLYIARGALHRYVSQKPPGRKPSGDGQ